LSDLADCILIGHYAGTALRTAGDKNVAIGTQSLLACQSGKSNTAVGYQSQMYATGTTGQNTTLGAHAGVYIVEGEYNTYLGYSAGACQTAGGNNVAVGRHALYGPYNAGVGPPAADASTSSNNVALGYESLAACAGGDANVCAGYQSGLAVTTGANNILIGANTGDNLTTGAGNILIGYDIAAAAVDSASTVNIGALIYGVQAAAVGDKRLGFFDITAPVAQAAHIADAATDITAANAAINAILVVLENLGFIAKS
jgi:hypothetical protein